MKVSAASAKLPGTSAYIEKSDELTVRELMYGMMLNSGNDAATCLAEAFGTFLYHEENESYDFIKKTTRIMVT